MAEFNGALLFHVKYSHPKDLRRDLVPGSLKLILISILYSSGLYAQFDTGQISGFVTDASQGESRALQ